MQKGRILLIFLIVLFLVFTVPFFIVNAYVFSEQHSNKVQSSLESPVYISPSIIPTIPPPTSTPSPTPTLTPSPTPTAVPTPTPTTKPKQNPSPTQVKTFSGGSTNLLSQVNDYRKSSGLTPVLSNQETCAFAKTRATEIASDFSHSGFTSRINSHTLPYGSYHEVTENIAMNSNENDVVSEWIKSSGHAENMRKNTPYVCIEKYGEYYVYEGLRP